MSTLQNFLSACVEIDATEGIVTWQSVDLETYTNDGKFQIFNTYTGQHEAHDNLVSAKARWNELKQQVTVDYLTPATVQSVPVLTTANLFVNPMNLLINSSNGGPSNLEIL